MSISHIVIIAVFFFIGGLGMAAVQSAFAAFSTQMKGAVSGRKPAMSSHSFPAGNRKLVWK